MAIRLKKWDHYIKEYANHDVILKDIIKEISLMEKYLMMIGGALVFQTVIFMTLFLMKWNKYIYSEH